MSGPDDREIASALRVLARALAPYVADELGKPAEDRPSTKADRSTDGAQLRRLVASLKPEVLAGAQELFQALSQPPHSIDSVTLGDRLGVSPAALSGTVLRPISMKSAELGLEVPWRARRIGGATEWTAVGDQAARLNELIAAEMHTRAGPARRARRTTSRPPTSRQRPARPPTDPVAVFPFAPEFADYIDEPYDGRSSCLRDSEPGTRAVIYRVHADQAVVALFDIGSDPYPDDDWRWMADGHYTPVPTPVPRERLLADAHLAPVFSSIQGRRWLPVEAQVALAELLARKGGFPKGLPPIKRAAADADGSRRTRRVRRR